LYILGYLHHEFIRKALILEAFMHIIEEAALEEGVVQNVLPGPIATSKRIFSYFNRSQSSRSSHPRASFVDGRSAR